MKLYNIFEEIITEATPQQIYNTYYSDIPFNIFKKIVINEPATKTEGREIKKIGRYAKLLLSMYKNKNLKLEDLPKAKEYLSYVYKHQITIDINRIKTLAELYNIIKIYQIRETKDLPTILNILNKDEYKKVFDGNEWMIFEPLTERAACYIGVNTEWCTTWGEYSLNVANKDKENAFNYYYKTDNLYIIINKKDNNEKYQFHFNSKQFMDRNDQKINISNFLSENKEIKYFFFPVFINKVTDENNTTKQLSRMFVLDSNDYENFILKIIKNSGKKNYLVLSILKNDLDGIKNLIIDKKIVDIDIDDKEIIFSFKNLTGIIDDVENTLSYYYNDKNNGNETIYNDISSWDEGVERMGDEFLEEYYNENKVSISNNEYKNYKMFKDTFFYDFINNDDIISTLTNEYVYANVENFEAAAQEEINNIEKYIKFEYSTKYYNVVLNKGLFSIFLLENDIKKINNVQEIIENYIEKNGINSEYLGIEYDTTYPKYNVVRGAIEFYFDDVVENIENYNECTRIRKLFYNIKEKYFNGNLIYEDDRVKIILDNSDNPVDCENSSTKIEFKDKNTGKTYKGNVKIDNLSSYITNYKLFEDLITFKKNIL